MDLDTALFDLIFLLEMLSEIDHASTIFVRLFCWLLPEVDFCVVDFFLSGANRKWRGGRENPMCRKSHFYVP